MENDNDIDICSVDLFTLENKTELQPDVDVEYRNETVVRQPEEIFSIPIKNTENSQKFVNPVALSIFQQLMSVKIAAISSLTSDASKKILPYTNHTELSKVSAPYIEQLQNNNCTIAINNNNNNNDNKNNFNFVGGLNSALYQCLSTIQTKEETQNVNLNKNIEKTQSDVNELFKHALLLANTIKNSSEALLLNSVQNDTKNNCLNANKTFLPTPLPLVMAMLQYQQQQKQLDKKQQTSTVQNNFNLCYNKLLSQPSKKDRKPKSIENNFYKNLANILIGENTASKDAVPQYQTEHDNKNVLPNLKLNTTNNNWLCSEQYLSNKHNNDNLLKSSITGQISGAAKKFTVFTLKDRRMEENVFFKHNNIECSSAPTSSANSHQQFDLPKQFNAVIYDGDESINEGDEIQISHKLLCICHTSKNASESNFCAQSRLALRKICRGDELVLHINTKSSTSSLKWQTKSKELCRKWSLEYDGKHNNITQNKCEIKSQKNAIKSQSSPFTNNVKEVENFLTMKTTLSEETENGYQCERCGKMFSYAYYREKHLKYTRCVDNGHRKYPCALCSRSFEKRDRLRIHVLHVHENHRPHVCTVCAKAFSQSSSLNKHLRVHSGERPYHCPFCTKCFTASSILRTHIRQHSGEKPFKCIHCGKSFASHAAHDSHVRRTHAAAPTSIQH